MSGDRGHQDARTGPNDRNNERTSTPLSRLISPRAILVVFAAVTFLALAVAASTSGTAFGAYNPAWDGASDLRERARAADTGSTIVRDVDEYPTGPAADGTVAVILSPDTPYTGAEIDRLRAFLRAGGTLVVAEDFGPHGNSLLADLGAGMRFDGRIVRDERYSYRSPAMPVARNVTAEGQLTAGVDRLTLNHGTVLIPGANATTLVSTSEFAYLDGNRNGELDDAEVLATRPVAAVEPVGTGRVIAVADPSLFINAMLDRSGNRAFVTNLFLASDRALLDYSHSAGVPPLAAALLAVRRSGLLQAGIGLAGVGAVAAWGAGLRVPLARRLGRRSGTDTGSGGPVMDAEAMTAYLTRRHPEWDAERVRRVTQGVLRGRTETGENDE